MKENEFEKLVERALLKLPDRIRIKMKNVAVCIEDSATDEQLEKLGMRHKNSLLGLYEGIPMNSWGRGWGNNLPDKITIFKIPISKMSENEKELEELVRDVVWHEVAHHFGFEEKEVSALESKWKSKRSDL